MERELLFADKLTQIRETAKAQGNVITKDQVEEAFADFSLEEDQYTLIYDYLKKHNIGVGEPVNTEENLSGDEKNFLQMYLDDLKEIEQVSEGEREAIVIQAMAGESAAQERLTTLFLPQIVDIAKLYAGQGVPVEDLIGEGNVAVLMGVKLLGAMENAKEAMSMLSKMIMDAMEDYIFANTEETKKDKHIAEKVNKVAEAAKKLSEDYGRDVTAEELSEESKLTLKMIQDAMRISGDKIENLEKK